MTNNLIQQGIEDDKLFKEEYPDKLINASEYVDRMQQSKTFNGFLPKPKENENSVPTEESLFTTNKIISILDETITLYTNIKKALKEHNKNTKGFETQNIFVSRGISELYLMSPGAYDKKTVALYDSFDTIVLNDDKTRCCSKVTFILALISSKISEFKDINSVKESIRSLLFTIATTFNPSIVANLLSSLMDVGVLDYIFGESLRGLMEELYETLVINEGILLSQDSYSNKLDCGFRTTDLVAYKLARFVFSNEEEILDDKNHFNWFGTILNPPVYDKYRKDIYTLILLDLIHSRTGRFRTTNRFDHMDNANRIIRKSITDWIKHKDISKRPSVPEVYKYINITPYLKDIYTHALITIGDMPNYIDQYEKIKESSEVEYNAFKKYWDDKCKNNSETTEEEREKLYTLKKEKEDAYKEYMMRLKHKSLIAFLYQEILSNEKIVAMSFDFDIIAFILCFEPSIDNAMHDTHTAVTALYNKRDFKPLGIDSINPYYCHASEGDIISEDTKLFATLLSGLANYNMGSRIACSFINTPVEAANVISNVEYTSMRSKLTLSNEISRHVDKAKEIANKLNDCEDLFTEKDKDYFSILFNSLNDYNFYVVESRNNLVVAINNFENNVDYANYTYKQEFNEMCLLHREYIAIKEGIVAYDETVWGENNIFEQIKKIFERCGSQTAIVTARGDIENDKRQYSFWPRINQYSYPIQDEDANPPKSKEQTAHESYYDLMPGDLESGRYKIPYERLDDRYSVSKGCD